MANTTLCTDTTEAIELFSPQNLYLKPIAKVNICVQLPQLKTAGKTISNWEVMEKIKHMVRPEVFLTLKIFKSTREFIRLEGEIENKGRIHTIILKLDGKTIKLSGFTDVLRVRAAEAKVNFPSRHDWDSYFRDAKTMDEMKPGERPDTIHIKDMPTRWFSAKQADKEGGGSDLMPSEDVVRKVFRSFGDVRCIDIPMLDPYRKEISANMKKTNIQTFSYGQDLTFECYIQYQDYISFVKAMDSLRGMKMLYKGDEKALTAMIKVDFDKTKHLSEKNIRRRRIERDKLEALERERLERARREKEEEERKKDEEKRKKEDEEREKERRRQDKLQRKEDRRKDREEKRRQMKLDKKKKEEEERIQYKIALEERKFLIAQRKLESLRLLTELFERVKAIRLKKYIEQKEIELEQERLEELEQQKREKEEEERRKKDEEEKKKLELQKQEEELRNKILKNFKAKEEQKQEIQRETLRKKISGTIKLKSAVIMTKAGSGPKKRKKGADSNEESGEDDNSQRKRTFDSMVGKGKKFLNKAQVNRRSANGLKMKSISGLKIKNLRQKPEAGTPWSSSSDEGKGDSNIVEEISSEEEENGDGSDENDSNSVLARVLKTNKMRAWREDVKDDGSLPWHQDDNAIAGSSRRANVKDGGRGDRRERGYVIKKEIDIKRESDQDRGGRTRKGDYNRDGDRGEGHVDWGRYGGDKVPTIGRNQRGRDVGRRGSVSPHRSSNQTLYSDDEEIIKEKRYRRGGSCEERGNRSREPERERSRSRSVVSVSSQESIGSGSQGRNDRERRRSRDRNRSREDRRNRSRSRSREREHMRRRPQLPPDGMPPMVPGPGGVMIPMPPFPMMFPGPMDMRFRPPFPFRGGRGGRGRGMGGPMRGRGMGIRGGAMMPFPVPPMAMFGPRFGGDDFYNYNNHMKDMTGRYAQPLQLSIPYKGRRGEDVESGSSRRHKKRKHRKRSKRSRSRTRSRSYDSRSSSSSRSRRSSRSRSRDRRRRRRSESDDRSGSRSRKRSKQSRSRSHSSDRKGRSRSRHRSRSGSKVSRSRSRRSSKSREGKSRSRSKDKRSRSRSKDRRSHSRSRGGKSRSRSKDKRNRSRSKDKRSRSGSKDKRSRSRSKDKRSRSRSKDRNSCSRERRNRSRSKDSNRSKNKDKSKHNEWNENRSKSKERDGHGIDDKERSENNEKSSSRNGERSWNNERKMGRRVDQNESEEDEIEPPVNVEIIEGGRDKMSSNNEAETVKEMLRADVIREQNAVGDDDKSLGGQDTNSTVAENSQ